jgi:hypothetical protein
MKAELDLIEDSMNISHSNMRPFAKQSPLKLQLADQNKKLI